MNAFVFSTSLFGNGKPGAAEFGLMAAHGFTRVELSAGAGRFDVRDPRHVAEVRELAFAAGVQVTSLAVALDDASLALHGAVDLGCSILVAHAGGCVAHGPAKNHAAVDVPALRRTIEHAADHAAEKQITLAVEFPASLPAEAIVELLESLDGPSVGVCLDVGHANLAGDAVEAIEILSGYIATIHLHDNNGRTDSHRAPFAGSVDWPATLMALWKTGFSGPAVVEILPDPDVTAAMTRAVGARTRLQAILDDLAQPMAFPE
jgi:sugar phosphate isomerase/epimerase